MEALHEQRGRMPGLVTIEKHASDAGDQNLFKLYLELVCWQCAPGVGSHTVTRFFSRAFSLKLCIWMRAGWEMTPAPPTWAFWLNFRFWGEGVSHTILGGKWSDFLHLQAGGDAVQQHWSAVCEWGSLSLTRDSGSRLSPLGCAYSLSHKDALRPAPVPVSLSRGSRVGNSKSAAVQLPFLWGCLTARCCLMQSEAGLCRHPGQPQPCRPEEKAGAQL